MSADPEEGQGTDQEADPMEDATQEDIRKFAIHLIFKVAQDPLEEDIDQDQDLTVEAVTLRKEDALVVERKVTLREIALKVEAEAADLDLHLTEITEEETIEEREAEATQEREEETLKEAPVDSNHEVINRDNTIISQ